MLTKLIEKVFEKCHRYWPKEQNIKTNYGSINLTLLKKEKLEGIVTRTFELESNVNYSKSSFFSPTFFSPSKRMK